MAGFVAVLAASTGAQAQSYDSTGTLWVGGFGQASWHSLDFSRSGTLTGTNGALAGSQSPTGLGGGIIGGYDWRLSREWSAGLILDAAIDRSRVRFDPGHSFNTDFMLTARGRVGYNLNRSWMLYGTGGFAALGVQYRGPGQSTSAVAKQDGTISGWVVGAGTELDLDGYSLFAEYLHTGFETWRFNAPDQALSYNADHSADVVRVGIKFKIGYDYDADIYRRDARRY